MNPKPHERAFRRKERHNPMNPIKPALAFVLLGLCSSLQAQENVLCFTSGGDKVPCGKSWSEVKDGVTYNCLCNCPYAPSCTPVNSSSGGGGYSPSGGSLESALEPVFEQMFDNLFKWLFSPSSSSGTPKQTQQTVQSREEAAAAEAAYQKRQEEYKAKVLEQLSQAKDQFEQQRNAKFGAQRNAAANDLKDRVAKSEATKAVRQANCAAFTSLEAVKSELYDFSDFTNPNGEAEQTRKGADFTTGTLPCPEVLPQVQEVTVAQPICFQEQFYQYVKQRSDSIKVKVEALKEKKATNDKVIEEKKQKIAEAQQVIEKQKAEIKPEIPNTPQTEEDNLLLLEALKLQENSSAELKTAEETEKKMEEEIVLNEKNISALEKMRSTYDVPQKPDTAQPLPTK